MHIMRFIEGGKIAGFDIKSLAAEVISVRVQPESEGKIVHSDSPFVQTTGRWCPGDWSGFLTSASNDVLKRERRIVFLRGLATIWAGTVRTPYNLR